MTKVCPHCGIEKSYEDFDKRSDRPGQLSGWCKPCRRGQSRDWKTRNPERTRELSRKSARASVYRRLANDPAYRMQNALAARIRGALKTGGVKAARTAELIGCSVAELRAHLERQFSAGMTWENWGKWHIDHKRPCASFDLTDPAQQRQCFHFSNLQPLWAADNIRKSDRF